MLVHSYCDTWIRDKDGEIIVTRVITFPVSMANIVISFDVAAIGSLFLRPDPDGHPAHVERLEVK
jgi:hypothetical protein